MFPVEVVQEYQEPEPEPETVTFEATAYTWTGCRTATGPWPSRGMVAVDPRVIPLGTELHIEGYGSAVAADTGGAIQGQKIDLYMDSEHECWQWGRRQVEVRVIEP
jgi:3D (Asp-Asp-Asp) domain-containing protein